jgi:hypothetical protein
MEKLSSNTFDDYKESIVSSAAFDLKQKIPFRDIKKFNWEYLSFDCQMALLHKSI